MFQESIYLDVLVYTDTLNQLQADVIWNGFIAIQVSLHILVMLLLQYLCSNSYFSDF